MEDTLGPGLPDEITKYARNNNSKMIYISMGVSVSAVLSLIIN